MALIRHADRQHRADYADSAYQDGDCPSFGKARLLITAIRH